MSPSSQDTTWIGASSTGGLLPTTSARCTGGKPIKPSSCCNLNLPQLILDIATGTGLAARACARITHAPQQIVGIDISHGMLQVAAAVSTSSYLQADAAKLPFRPATFDALLCVAAIPTCLILQRH
jgi:SAM-dependent methyltransferase